jgi:hypothetical protein
MISELKFSQWATVTPADGWQLIPGFFMNVEKADLFGYDPSGGEWVGRNMGPGFSFQKWGTVSPASGWEFAAGDFTGKLQERLYSSPVILTSAI